MKTLQISELPLSSSQEGASSPRRDYKQVRTTRFKKRVADEFGIKDMKVICYCKKQAQRKQSHMLDNPGR